MAQFIWCWHPWHNTLLARCNLVWRRETITGKKPLSEIPLRLKLFKRANLGSLARQERDLLTRAPATDIFSFLPSTLVKKVMKLHRRQCPRCPWGRGIREYHKETCIFTRRKKNGEWY